jgi:hypothetical protein
MDENEFECALSGVSTAGDGGASPDDELEDLPVGWTKVTFERRRYNPEWVAIQQVKSIVKSGIMSTIPEEIRAESEWTVDMQVRSQFFVMEQATPRYMSEVEEVYISDSSEVVEPYNEIRDQLGLDPVDFSGASHTDEDE